MTSFIDADRGQSGIEPICRELGIALFSYHELVRDAQNHVRFTV